MNAFQRATELREQGDLPKLQKLYAESDAATKVQVLNGLAGRAGGGPEVALGIVDIGVDGARQADPAARRWACQVVQQQAGYKVDISAAVEVLLDLLSDPDEVVRGRAAYAVGNVCKQRHDWSRHFHALQRLLHDDYLYNAEAAARALADLSRAKFDIGPAVAELATVLAGGDRDYDEPRKEAAKALLHHARKSAENCRQVREAVREAKTDGHLKEVRRLIEQLDAL